MRHTLHAGSQESRNSPERRQKSNPMARGGVKASLVSFSSEDFDVSTHSYWVFHFPGTRNQPEKAYQLVKTSRIKFARDWGAPHNPPVPRLCEFPGFSTKNVGFQSCSCIIIGVRGNRLPMSSVPEANFIPENEQKSPWGTQIFSALCPQAEIGPL